MGETCDPIRRMKVVLREDDIPFFTDEQLSFYLDECKGDVHTALYKCLLIKAEDTTLQVSGLNVNDTSAYFRRMASMYRPTNSGILKGV